MVWRITKTSLDGLNNRQAGNVSIYLNNYTAFRQTLLIDLAPRRAIGMAFYQIDYVEYWHCSTDDHGTWLSHMTWTETGEIGRFFAFASLLTQVLASSVVPETII